MTNKNKAHKHYLSVMNRTIDNQRIKQDIPELKNLMQFMEIVPLNSTDVPYPRSGHRAVATESDLWIWGGYHPTGSNNHQPKMFDELWRFNFALQRWTLESTTGDRPNGTLASHSMHLYGHLVLVFGGTGFPFGHNVSNDLFILDLKRRHWKRCQFPNSKPAEVYGASMIIHDEHLYILCGTDSMTYNTDIYDIHLPTLACTQIGFTFNEMEGFAENGRYRQEAYLYNNKIYVFGGGGTSGISYSLETLPVFDLTDRQWSFVQTNPDSLHNYPLSRKFHSVFSFRDNQVIVFGGAHFDQTLNRHSAVDGSLWIFNFMKIEWTRLTLNMPRPTYFHAAAVNEHGELWSHGGVIRESTMNDNEIRITTLYKMNICVLKLAEISWNLFLNCLSNRMDLLRDRSILSKLHIPARFAERIY